jgi:hypothetical protein
MMRDDAEEKLVRLFAAARSDRGSTESAEEFFETRLMALLRERRETRSPWYEQAWRCVPAFALVTALFIVCSITIGQPVSSDLFAAITSGQDEYLAKSFMSGE